MLSFILGEDLGLTAIIFRYAYLGLFTASLAERIGIPLLMTPLLVGAGVLAAGGTVRFWPAVLVSTIACLVGDQFWYEVARRKGGVVMRLLCRISLEQDSCVRKAKRSFAKRSDLFLMISKFVPGVSHIAPAAAGAAHADRWEFILFNAAGSALWVFAMTAIGYIPAKKLQWGEAIAELSPAVIGVTLVLLGLNVVVKAYRRGRFIKMVSAARISPEEVKARMDAGEEMFIVDLRHMLDVLANPQIVPGAVRMAPDALEARHQEIPRDREIILYCT